MQCAQSQQQLIDSVNTQNCILTLTKHLNFKSTDLPAPKATKNVLFRWFERRLWIELAILRFLLNTVWFQRYSSTEWSTAVSLGVRVGEVKVMFSRGGRGRKEVLDTSFLKSPHLEEKHNNYAEASYAHWRSHAKAKYFELSWLSQILSVGNYFVLSKVWPCDIQIGITIVFVPVCVYVALLVVVRGDCQLSLQIVQLYSESQLHLKWGWACRVNVEMY